jgi:MFS family permease
MADLDESGAQNSVWRAAAVHDWLRPWAICGLLLLATMLMYMDRQTLAQQKTEISRALELSNLEYGWLETGFGLAFAVGGIITGIIADRISPRWLYPTVLLGWSSVGFVTGWATSYRELLVCRVLLGFFESGHWPCALVAVQRMLSRRDRTLGNSILQSGASLGVIATAGAVWFLTSEAVESWRLPFRVIGAAGIFWVVAWLAMIRSTDLEIKKDRSTETDDAVSRVTGDRSFVGRHARAIGPYWELNGSAALGPRPGHSPLWCFFPAPDQLLLPWGRRCPKDR